MGKLGCSIDGNLNETKFSEPMPWIGIYIAAASLACAVAMASDAISGFRRRKFWFPCKFFSINATSLTVIGVASKLSVDLNTPMPRHMDQLAKLSSTVLICTVMGNSMPSLGTMENTEILSNVVALGILVVTLVVNICIQIGTGVIFVFWKEHAFVLFLMIVLLVIFSFSSLTVPTNKRYLEQKYKKKYELAMKECYYGTEKSTAGVNKLKEDLMRFWMMAHTSSPQFVMGRSVTCAAAGALCLLSAATLAETMLRSYMLPQSFEFCKGESDYKWSIALILLTQTIAVAVGTIAPATRWFTAIKFRCPKRGRESCRQEFQLERYWIQTLVEMKECPLGIPFRNRYCRKLAHDAKKLCLNLCIAVQIGIVFISKVIRLISISFVARIWLCLDFCSKLKSKGTHSITNDPESESQSSTKPDLGRFVLHLEGEDVLVKIMMKDNRDATEYWMHRAQRKQPRYLIKLLEIRRASKYFEGVKEFDSNQVPCLDTELPPNCWALPVVTLASIAVALPSIDGYLIKMLIYGVNEGLTYVRHIENTLNCEKDLTNIRWAADVVWLGVELYQRWLDVDLHKLSLEGKAPREILEVLSDSAKNKLMKFKNVGIRVNQCLVDASKWPIKALAANSMYRISQTILQNCESRKYETGERLFETLTAMISDILSACLTNLQRAILVKCLSSTIEEREDCVRRAVHLLGQTEKIIKLLEQKTLPTLDPDQMADIDEWRVSYKLENPSPLHNFPSSESETVCSTSSASEIYLTIEDNRHGTEKIDTSCD
ncbi:hypothetical protein SLA2020_499310 [Shorea laevis]